MHHHGGDIAIIVIEPPFLCITIREYYLHGNHNPRELEV